MLGEEENMFILQMLGDNTTITVVCKLKMTMIVSRLTAGPLSILRQRGIFDKINTFLNPIF